MTQTFKFKQSSDLDPALSDPATRTLSADKLVGRWANTDPRTKGLYEIVIEQEGDVFVVSAVGVGESGPIEWPKTEAVAPANPEGEAGERPPPLAATFAF